MNALVSRLPAFMRRVDPAVATSFACILLLLFLGSLYSSNFLSPEYLLQQLKVASFLGIIATGMMLVILLGQIDLSLPWVVSCWMLVGGRVAQKIQPRFHPEVVLRGCLGVLCFVNFGAFIIFSI